jgi:hypothetical protein
MLELELYAQVLRHLKTLFPGTNLRSAIDLNPPPGSVVLQTEACFFDYVIVNQHRYHAANRSVSNPSRLVEVVVAGNGSTWAGELMDIIHLEQPTSGLVFTLGHFRWFRPLQMDLTKTIWNAL